MITMSCHSGTKKEEIIDFVQGGLGRTIIIHFEHNLYDYWGDDDEYKVELLPSNLHDVLEFIRHHYIHNVTIL